MRRTVTSVLVIAVLALTAGAKVIDMEGRKASVVGPLKFQVKRVGKIRGVADFDLDFDTRTWTGTMMDGSLELAGSFAFVGRGGRKLDLSYDAESLADVEEYFAGMAEAVFLEKKGQVRDLTAHIAFYKLNFRLSKSKKKAKCKCRFRVEYTDDESEEYFKGIVKMPLKGAAAREDV